MTLPDAAQLTLQEKLAAFAVVAGPWLAWLVAGLAAGGVLVVLQRALYLLREVMFTPRRRGWRTLSRERARC